MSQLPTTKTSTKKVLRQRRHTRVRAKISGTADRPRLTIFKSNRFLSAQLIDDVAGRTLVASNGRLGKEAKKQQPLSAQASAVGAEIAKKAKEAGISTIVFDRSGYMYEGQVKALAEAAREGGLTF
jgi:large subunit ribosomal protein L18